MTMGQCRGRVLASKQPGLSGQGQGSTREQSRGVQATLDHPVPILTWEQIQNRHRDLLWLWASPLQPVPKARGRMKRLY